MAEEELLPLGVVVEVVEVDEEVACAADADEERACEVDGASPSSPSSSDDGDRG